MDANALGPRWVLMSRIAGDSMVALSMNEITDNTSAATMNTVWLRDRRPAASLSVVVAAGCSVMTLPLRTVGSCYGCSRVPPGGRVATARHPWQREVYCEVIDLHAEQRR